MIKIVDLVFYERADLIAGLLRGCELGELVDGRLDLFGGFSLSSATASGVNISTSGVSACINSSSRREMKSAMFVSNPF